MTNENEKQQVVETLIDCDTPWIACLAQLWHHCVILWNDDTERQGRGVHLKEALINIHIIIQDKITFEKYCELITLQNTLNI